MSTFTYSVPGMTCGHCVNAITSELTAVAGVTEVSVDLTTKLVVVAGTDLQDDAMRAAIEEAGFEPAS
jgi:copper chaperone